MIHPSQTDDSTLLADCQVTRTRRSGPGGQHRNKVETAIVVVHNPTGIRGQASERRSQSENLKVALFRLRVNLAIQLRYAISEDYAPSPLWQSRLKSNRIQISIEHTDFPAMLAEAMSLLAVESFELAAAAARLRCSTTQLLKLISVEPQCLAEVNRQRGSLGKRNLHPR